MLEGEEMNTEEEEFNRIEREAKQRMEAVSTALKDHEEYLRKRLVPERTWVGLTYDEFKQIMLATYNIDLNVLGHSSDDYLLWNAIETKLKEKNEM
jgi:hypothetical protein